MSEYKVSLKEFFHDFTPTQIRYLDSKIDQRKATDLRHLLLVFHTSKPQELSDTLHRGSIGRKTGISKANKERFNITVIGKPPEGMKEE